MNGSEMSNFIWTVADLLRHDYKQHEYGAVILPFTVLRRLDCVLEKTKDKVLKKFNSLNDVDITVIEKVLNNESGFKFHNVSSLNFEKLINAPDDLYHNMIEYIKGYSTDAREIIEKFDFYKQLEKLEEKNLLFLVTEKFKNIDLHPDKVTNVQMGYVFEELIRKFAEISNETAGEHFTPREVIRLMVNVLFCNDNDILSKSGIVKKLYDCACGTGGMLSVADEYVTEHNSRARLEVFGQEINAETFAVCKSDMMIKGQSAENIKYGNSFTDDGLPGEKFDYMLANPPFGVEWKKFAKTIKDEHSKLGYGGRFGPGLPRISDGSLLFLLHMISKMKQDETGSKIGIVFNGSPLFTGNAGSGESEIRRWIIENDMLEAVIALPNQLFYNTGISTYIWILNNRKEDKRKGKVQLINAVSFYQKMSKSLGNKRNEISEEGINKITGIYGDFKKNKYCKIFNNSDFGYSRITVERPLMENGKPVTDSKGNPKPDASLRDYENVPLKPGQIEASEEDIKSYMEKEVLPHVPDAWVDHSKTKTGYEINFTRYFYEYKPLRNLEEIRKDILILEKETEGLLDEVLK